MQTNNSEGKISLEKLWNKFALCDVDEQRKKIWLDIFLCRALVWNPEEEDQNGKIGFLHNQNAKTRVGPNLVSELKMEIGAFCSSTLAAEDLDQLKRYVYSGRGWKLLSVLDKILSNLSSDPPFLAEEDTKELTDLLISLYQLSVFPQEKMAFADPMTTNAPNTEESVSALDLWHQTLIGMASSEHEKAHDANLESILSTDLTVFFHQILDLWHQLYSEDKNQHKKYPHFGHMTKLQKRRAAKTLLRGFASNNSISSIQNNYRVSNLFSFERRCATSRLSSDSETVEVEGLQRHKNRLPPYLKNPMDFRFFDEVIRSEAEGTSQAQWQKLKSRLIRAPVTPSLDIEDIEEDKQEVDLQAYLAPNHFGCMFAKLSESQLSSLVIKLLGTISIVEIRWKSRQRRIRSPALTPTTLYPMSYPLVQFAADSLRNSSIHIQLRINLVALLLTSLSDVSLSNDLQALHDLLHHYKVLNKCADVVHECFRPKQTSTSISSSHYEQQPSNKPTQAIGTMSNNEMTAIHLTTILLRTFRTTLEKYGNPKFIADPKVSSRSKKEDVVKHICLWFSQEKLGMAHLLNTCVLQSNQLIQCDEKLVGIIFHEIGAIMRLVGLCPLPSQKASKARSATKSALTSVASTENNSIDVEFSYNYLKDTRSALISVVRNILQVFPDLVAGLLLTNDYDFRTTTFYIQIIVDCLKTSGACVHPYTACSSFLKVLEVVQIPDQQVDKALEYLELVYSHHYNKHDPVQFHHQAIPTDNEDETGLGVPPGVSGSLSYHHHPAKADSDSAFYASDSSLLFDQQQHCGGDGVGHQDHEGLVSDQTICYPERPETQHRFLEHWTSYLQCLTSDDEGSHFKTRLLKHLDKMIVKLTSQGKLDMFDGLILPLLEKENAEKFHENNLTKNSSSSVVNTWAMKAARKLMTNCKQVYEFLCEHSEKYSALVQKLLKLNINTMDCDCSLDAFECLKRLSVLEITTATTTSTSRRLICDPETDMRGGGEGKEGSSFRKVSQEEGVGVSDEDIDDNNTDCDQKVEFQMSLGKLSCGVVIPMIVQHLNSSSGHALLETDLNLWIIQRALILKDAIYVNYFLQNIDLHHFLLETIRTATDQSLDTNKMELFIVILQILSLVINRKRDKIRFKELKRHFIEFLIQKTYFIDDNNTIRKNIAKKSLSILISCDIIIIGATNDDAYSRNANTRKVNIGDENDADVESDTQDLDGVEVAYEVLSTDGIERSIQFMRTILIDEATIKNDDFADIIDHGLNKFLPILYSNASKIFHLGLNRFALDIIKASKNKNLTATALKVCEIFAESNAPVAKEDFVTMIDIIKAANNNNDVIEKLLKLFHKMISFGWNVKCPPSFANFPVMRSEKNPKHAWVKRPWVSFSLPTTVENLPNDFLSSNTSFSISVWLSLQENPGATPLHAISLGSRRLALELWIVANSLAVRVTTDVTPYLGKTNPIGCINYPRIFPQDKDWHNLVVNGVVSANGLLLKIELFLDGESSEAKRLSNDVLSLKSVVSPNVELTQADVTKTIHVGHVVDEELDARENYNFSHFWLFSRPLTKSESLILYLMGPSVPDLMMHPCPFMENEPETEEGHIKKKQKPLFGLTSLKSSLLKSKMLMQHENVDLTEIHELLKEESDGNLCIRSYEFLIKNIRRSLLASHFVGHGPNLWLYPTSDATHAGRKHHHPQQPSPSSSSSSKVERGLQTFYTVLGVNFQAMPISNNTSPVNKKKSATAHHHYQDLDDKLLIEGTSEDNGVSNLLLMDVYSTSWIAAIEQSGGFGLILLLLARVVEVNANDKCIAAALNIALKVLEEASINISIEANENDVYALLKHILRSGKAKIGLFSLKTLLDHCLSTPLLEFDQSRDRFTFASNFNGVVLNQHLIELIIDCWDLWKNNANDQDRPPDQDDFHCLEAVLVSLVALIQDSHAYRDVNVAILKRLKIIEKLGYSLKNDLLSSSASINNNKDCTNITASAAGNGNKIEVFDIDIVPTVIEVFGGLVGSPPDIDVITELMQVALFLQDVANNYIHHSSRCKSFYFEIPSPTSGSGTTKTSSSLTASTWPRNSSIRSRTSSTTAMNIVKSASFTHSNGRSNRGKTDRGGEVTSFSKTFDSVVTTGDADDNNLTKFKQPYEEIDQPVEQSTNVDHKLDPKRLRKILSSSNKRTQHSAAVRKHITGAAKFAVTTPYYNNCEEEDYQEEEIEVPIVHFGRLSRLDSSKSTAGNCSGGNNLLLPDAAASDHDDLDFNNDDVDDDDLNETIYGDMASEDDDDAVYHHPQNPIEGILNILHGAMLNMPDSSVATVMTSVILPEHLLTLSNHPLFEVRLSSIRLLFKYVQRTERLHPNGYRVEKVHGYQLLASQLFNWGCSTGSSKQKPNNNYSNTATTTAAATTSTTPPMMDKMASAILSFIHGLEVYTTSRIPELPIRGAQVRTAALPPLLAMLPVLAAAGSQHVATTHNLVIHVHDIIARVPNVLKTDYETVFLFESLCNTLDALLNGSSKLWTMDVVGQDGRDILKEDLDYIFRFIGLHFVAAHGVSNFRAVEKLVNIMLHMAHHHDTIEDQTGRKHFRQIKNKNIGLEFRKYAANILTDCISELIERIERLDRQKGRPNTSMGYHSSVTFANQFATTSSANDNGLPNEEVTELLMKSILDDHHQHHLLHKTAVVVTPPQPDRPPAPRGRGAAGAAQSFLGSSAANSFSFKADPLRSHTNDLNEAGIKPATRSDLADRLHHLVDIATEMCLHMPANALHKDFMTSMMSLFMSQLQTSSSATMRLSSSQRASPPPPPPLTGSNKLHSNPPPSLLPLTFCKTRLMAIIIYALHQSVPLQDRLHILQSLHRNHPYWPRLFHQLAIQDGSTNTVEIATTDQIQLYRFFVFKLAKEYEAQQSYHCKKSTSASTKRRGRQGKNEVEEDVVVGEVRGIDSIDSMTSSSSGDLTSLLEAATNHVVTMGGIEIDDPDHPIIRKYNNQQVSNTLSFARRIQLSMARVIRQHRDKVSTLVSKSFEVTGASMVAQESFRKAYLVGLRDGLASDVSSRETVINVIQRLVHQRGIWGSRSSIHGDSTNTFESNDTSSSWILDEVEGPHGMRIRLGRAKKSLDSKYYLADDVGLPNCSSPSPALLPEEVDQNYEPFEYLRKQTVDKDNNNKKHPSSFDGLAGIMVTQLSQSRSSSVKLMEKCFLIVCQGEVPGEVLLTEECLYFVQHGQIDPPPFNQDKKRAGISNLPLRISMVLDHVSDVFPRWYRLNDCALELFFEVGSGEVTRMLAFVDKKARDSFLKHLGPLCKGCWSGSEDAASAMASSGNSSSSTKQHHLNRAKTLLALHTQQWQEGQMTNFDYLMQINKFAGRTFNDLMQYPIMPFVLADYQSDSIDLTNPKTFRDLRKPMAIQRRDREEQYRANYRALSSHEMRKSVGGGVESPQPGTVRSADEPFHYGSHYSNSGIVLHFLTRLPPFTSMFLRFQDGNFDLPDRTFHNIEATWRLASGDSSSGTDVKELIPELFYLPEMLINGERLDLGVKQDGERVDDVILPPWAKGDPRQFIKIHRQALESDYVRENLHHWIDLIFGYKQTGPAAVEALNVFHPATYYGFDLNSIQDEIDRLARATMIKTYGQTPKQLFDRPHPMARCFKLSAVGSQMTRLDLPLPTSDNITAGLKWGNVIGIVRHERVFADFSEVPGAEDSSSRGPVVLTSVSQDRVFGLKPFSVALIKFAQLQPQSFNSAGGGLQMTASAASGACIIYQDPITGWAEAWLKKNKMPQALVPLTSNGGGIDHVTAMANAPGSSLVWIGYKSGKLTVLDLDFQTSLQVQIKSMVSLYGHNDAITCISASREWSIVVTSSLDGTSIIWDTRKLAYIRTIRDETPSSIVTAEGASTGGGSGKNANEKICENTTSSSSQPGNRQPSRRPHQPHRLVQVSRTSGDIAVVNQPNDILLFSINGGRHVASRRAIEPTITALAFSNESDGVAVNVIATGHATTGVIRLFSSWDLTPLRDICTGHPKSSVFSIEFSRDGKNLYVSFQDGFLVIFKATTSSSSSVTSFSQRPPNYLDLSRVISRSQIQ